MDDDLWVSEDIAGLEPRETREITKTLDLPVSVFEYCGFDALEASVRDSENVVEAVSDQRMFALEAPINLKLNDGNEIVLNDGDTFTLNTTYETNLFVEVTDIVYSVDDTSVASVDENGVITALGGGTATVTATLMPSGRTVSTTLKVLDGSEIAITTDADAIKYGESIQLETNISDQTITWTSSDEAIATVDENGNVTGIKPGKVTITATTENGYSASVEIRILFTDVAADAWYYDAISWAAENGITVGLNDGTGRFGVGQKCTRGMLVTFLYRFAVSK